MGNRLIIAVYFFQTVPNHQAVAQVSIAQVIPGGRVFRFRVHGSFGYIRLGGCGCFRCGWLCLRLFHFRRGWCGGVRQKPEHIQGKLLALFVLLRGGLFLAGEGSCRRCKTAGGFFRMLTGAFLFFLFLLLLFLAFLLQDSFGQRGE